MTVIRTGATAEVLALIDHSLGFRPERSLVCVSLRGVRVGLIARIDAVSVDASAEQMASYLVADKATNVLVIAYTDDSTEAHDTALTMTSAAQTAGLNAAAWWVTAEDFRAIDPEHPDLCPTTGTPLDTLTGTQIAAEMVAAGSAPRAHREDLAVRPAEDTERHAAHAAYLAADPTTTTEQRAAALATWRAALTDGLTPAQGGTLAARLLDPLVRDAVLIDAMPGGPGVADEVVAGDVERIAPVLRSVIDADGIHPDSRARRASTVADRIAALTDGPDAYAVGAFLAWWQGNGAAAQVRLEQIPAEPAEASRLAGLVQAVLDHGMGPGWTR